MSEGVVLNPTRLVLAAMIGLVILLVLIIKFNVQAMIAILIVSTAMALLVLPVFYVIMSGKNQDKKELIDVD